MNKRPSIDDLKVLLANKTNTQERNKTTAEAYRQGYSQHMIAKVSGLNQATVKRIVKRM